ncbi:MAG: DEAD/DEAH box helicase family protein [Patescibacteria group bacterium]|nr:DEAD/DEAH box helicase family protein [Patescibacteria group bacterium]
MSGYKLSNEYDSLEKRGRISKDIPSLIFDNINPKFQLRSYQISAISRLIEYYENEPEKEFPVQLLFNMATGSGKTLIMVTAMLFLYEKGYRNFVFFVDKTNIIRKTIDNFLNKESSKYLFNKRIFIDGQEVLVKKVESFSESSDNAININFSTIAGLHSKLNNPKENSLIYRDFEKGKTVFISDEAHHINAETKRKKSKEEFENINSWEKTVNKLVNSHQDNVLLEFTATIDWEDEYIFDKYKSRVLFEYDLKKFREDKFSKDVFLAQSNSSIEERMLQSVVISQFRRKAAESYKIALKPVVMMKSKTIKESQDNHQKFIKLIQNLKVADFKSIEKIVDGISENDNILKKAFDFFNENKIRLSELVSNIKIEFSDDRLVEVNSNEESEQKQIQVNTLEEEDNEVRVVFAVDKLNEGWDVLNLFDIVRLYGTRDSGKPTIQEAQLVGRGARYFPFTLDNKDEKYLRKFDEEENHPLRVIEQLHFHSIQNHRYISELRSALIKSGIHKDAGREIVLKVKNSFSKTKFFKKGVIWKNERIVNKRDKVNSIFDVGVERNYKTSIESGSSFSQISGFGDDKEKTKSKYKVVNLKIKSLSQHLTRKTLDKIPFYNFENLNSYFPKLKSIKDFIENKNYLGGVNLEIETDEENIESTRIFQCLLPILENIKNTIKANTSEYQGSKKFIPIPVRESIVEKKMYIEKPIEGSKRQYGASMVNDANSIYPDLSDKDWYVYSDDYGTDEEKYLVKLIHDNIDKLETKYKEVYLVRNQKIVEIYDFDKGRRFEPDYLLFLGNGKVKGDYFQLFIEPKGRFIEEGDKWKEEFLLKIKAEKEIVNLFEDDKYIIVGLPFYQEDNKLEFKKSFGKKIDIIF